MTAMTNQGTPVLLDTVRYLAFASGSSNLPQVLSISGTRLAVIRISCQRLALACLSRAMLIIVSSLAASVPVSSLANMAQHHRALNIEMVKFDCYWARNCENRCVLHEHRSNHEPSFADNHV